MTRSGLNLGEHVAFFLCTVGVLLGLAAPVAAQDPSQAGGLPALEARVKVLEGMVNTLSTALAAETAARQAADAQLQNAINAEAAARQAAVASLQTAINSETAARQSADASLQNAISAEVAARQGAVASLQAALSAETAARQAADGAIQSQTTTAYSARTPTSFVNLAFATFFDPPPTEVVSLNLPAGAYVLVAAITAVNADDDDDSFVTCSIPGDRAITGKLGEEVEPGEIENLVMTSVISHGGGAVKVTCARNSSENDNTRAWGGLTAIRIGAIGQ